jgi:predicted transcriptional regulator
MDKEGCDIPNYNLEGEDLESFLGPLESKVLETVWSCEKYPITVRDIFEKMSKSGKIAYTSVMTTMDRLHGKGFLERSIEKGKGGLYYVYWPKMSKAEFQEHALRKVMDNLVAKFGKGMVASCLDDQGKE